MNPLHDRIISTTDSSNVPLMWVDKWIDFFFLFLGFMWSIHWLFFFFFSIQCYKVVWGEVSMIEAEKLLLSTALNDPSNQRFILLSDRSYTDFLPIPSTSILINFSWNYCLCSCVPLHNFTYIYNYVMSSSKSFVDRFCQLRWSNGIGDFFFFFWVFKTSDIWNFSFSDEKDKRYNRKMSPVILKTKWRKGSQVHELFFFFQFIDSYTFVCLFV